MTSVDVEILINEEIKDRLTGPLVYGINLPECLVRPVLEDYTSARDHSRVFRLWTVLVESENGYRIFYDEEENNFGLASKAMSGQLMYLASYGTFLQTLEAM